MCTSVFARALAVVLAVLIGAGPVVAQQVQPSGPPVKFEPPRAPDTVPRIGEPFHFSFCDPPTTKPSDICGNLTGGTANPTGGTPPYYFKLDTMGGFLPFGLTLHPNGLVTGTPTAVGSREFRVCAIDQVGNSQCIVQTLNVRDPRPVNTPSPQETPKAIEEKTDASKSGSSAGLILGLVGAAVGLGVGLGALAQMETTSEADCGTAPTIPNSCLGSGRNTATCNQIISDYSNWCGCMGRTFNVNTGSCR